MSVLPPIINTRTREGGAESELCSNGFLDQILSMSFHDRTQVANTVALHKQFGATYETHCKQWKSVKARLRTLCPKIDICNPALCTTTTFKLDANNPEAKG